MTPRTLGGTVQEVLDLRHRTLVRYLAYIALWLAVFFAGAWPAWKAAYRNSDRIAAADARAAACCLPRSVKPSSVLPLSHSATRP